MRRTSSKGDGIGVEVFGVEQTTRQIHKLANIVDDKSLIQAFYQEARDMAARMIRLAPRGETGNLRRGIIAKKFKNPTPGKPGAFVGINFKKAPHAHLIEFGHQLVRGGRLEKSGRVVGNVPPHPFFRPIVRSWHKLSRVELALKKLIEQRSI